MYRYSTFQKTESIIHDRKPEVVTSKDNVEENIMDCGIFSLSLIESIFFFF